MVERVKVEGFSALQAKLRLLPKGVAKSVLQKVGKKVLKPIADHARELAPKRTGALRRSIHVGTRLSQRQHELYPPEAGEVEVFAGAGPLPQAHMQEFGTSTSHAQPFMRPAWDAGKVKLLADIETELWAEIRKALGG